MEGIVYCGVCGGGDVPGNPVNSLRNCETCPVSVHEACLPAKEVVLGVPWSCRNCRNGGGLCCQACCPVESTMLLRVPYLEAATLHQHELCRRACEKALNVDAKCELCDGEFSYYRVTCSKEGCDNTMHPGCAHQQGCRIDRIQVPVNGCDLVIYCREHSSSNIQERTLRLTSLISGGFPNTNVSSFECPFPSADDEMLVASEPEYEYEPEPEPEPDPAP